MKASHVEPSQAFGGGLGWVPLVYNVDGGPTVGGITGKIIVPFRFQVVAVSAYAVGGVGSVDSVVVGTKANIVGPTAFGIGDAAPPSNLAIIGPVANARGMANEAITIKVTDTGLSGGTVTIWVRPYPMKGEA